jgi:hypothetical protein
MCHSERRRRISFLWEEILRFAQDDKARLVGVGGAIDCERRGIAERCGERSLQRYCARHFHDRDGRCGSLCSPSICPDGLLGISGSRACWAVESGGL